MRTCRERNQAQLLTIEKLPVVKQKHTHIDETVEKWCARCHLSHLQKVRVVQTNIFARKSTVRPPGKSGEPSVKLAVRKVASQSNCFRGNRADSDVRPIVETTTVALL